MANELVERFIEGKLSGLAGSAAAEMTPLPDSPLLSRPSLSKGRKYKGKFDFLPEVLDELGVKKLFHRVSQRPGKPFWAGVTDNCNVFAFPGNPVSTFVNCLVYFHPWYYKSVGLQQEKQTVILAKDITFKPNLSCFMQVNLTSKNGQVYATPIQGNGSGDLASLVEADGFIELPKTEEIEFKKGSVFPILTYRGF